MSYYNNYNPDILSLVDIQHRNFLEVGCGAGALASAIKNIIPNSKYLGIDIEASVLQQAKERGAIDSAVCLDINNTPEWDLLPELLNKKPNNGFDCFIFGDVLEHLYQPENLINQAERWLTSNGTIIASIPNVQHWSVFIQLIYGSWPRTDSGLFDRTHIRWFTLTDMCKLFEKDHLKIEKIVPRIFEKEKGLVVAEYLEPLSTQIGIDPEKLTDKILPLQYVIKARKI